jgi:hypothetical protein
MLKNYRVLTASAVVLVLVVAAALAWESPDWFPASVVQAAKARDSARLEQLIDFPAVKDGLKSDLKPLMAQAVSHQLAGAGVNVETPLAARLGAVADTLADSAVGQMLDQIVTPTAIEQLVDDQPVQVTAMGRQSAPIDEIFPKGPTGARFLVTRKHLGFGGFRYSLSNLSGRSSVDVDLVRNGLFSWRVQQVTPNISLSELIGGDTAQPAPAEAQPPPPPSDETTSDQPSETDPADGAAPSL